MALQGGRLCPRPSPETRLLSLGHRGGSSRPDPEVQVPLQAEPPRSPVIGGVPVSAWGAASLYQTPQPGSPAPRPQHWLFPEASLQASAPQPSSQRGALLTAGRLACRRLPQSRASQQEGPRAAPPPDKEQAGFLLITWAGHTGILCWVCYGSISIFTSGKVVFGENFCPAFILL